MMWANIDFKYIVYFSAIPLIANIIIAFLIVEPPVHKIEEENSWKHMKKAMKLFVTNKKLRLLAIGSSVQTGSGYANYNFAPGFIEQVWSAASVPAYRTVQYLVGATSFWITDRLFKKFDKISIMTHGSLITSSAMIIAYLMANIVSPIFLLLGQVYYAFNLTADQALQHENFTYTQRATMGSLISLATYAVTGTGAIVLGLLADATSAPIACAIWILFRLIVVQTCYTRLYIKHR